MKRAKIFLAALLACIFFSVTTQTASAETQRCPKYERLLIKYSPGWDVDLMSYYMWREARCKPKVRSSTRDSGLLQINDINHAYLRRALGEWVDSETLKRPKQNVRAAAELCKFWTRAGKGCYYPWKTN